jgi:predicted ATPase
MNTQHVVITGSHSVGKTSILRAIEKSWGGRGIGLIPEMARILIEEGVAMNADIDEYGVCSYMAKYLRYRRETRSSLVLSDRSIFDLQVYLSLNPSPLIRENVRALVKEETLEEIRKYHFLYVPIEFSMVIDGVRPDDEAYRKMVDGQVISLLKEYDASFSIVMGSLDARVTQIEAFLDEISHRPIARLRNS